jgi:hypothetical protein
MADFNQGFGRFTPKLPKDYNLKNELVDIGLLANSFAPVTGDIQSGLLAANDIKNGNYGSAALNGLGVLPFIPSMAGMIASKGGKMSDAIKPLTKWEQKIEDARIDAWKNHGLPENNTAMDRANALGFDQDAYTGVNTTGEIDQMLPKSWFSESKKYASDYSNVTPKSGVSENPRVYPVMLRTGNVKSQPHFGLYDDMNNALSKKRTDTFKIENVGGGEDNHFVTKYPNQVRSRFAAFNMSNANSNDLLGYSTPEMMGLLGLGSAAGVGYAYNKKEKK